MDGPKFLGLALLLLTPSACLSKGDTVVNGTNKVTEDDDEAGMGGEPNDSDDDAPEPEPDDEPSTSDDDTAVGEGGEGGTPATDPIEPSPTPNGQGGDTSTTPSNEGGSAGDDVEEPEQSAEELGPCTEGQEPGTSEPVQLTDATGTKRGLRVSAGPDGFLVAWQAVGTKSEVAYQAFDADLGPQYAAQKIVDVEDNASGIATSWHDAEGAFAMAYDSFSTAYVTWIDDEGMASEPLNSELATIGAPLSLSVAAEHALVSAMSSGGGCQGTGRFAARSVNVDTAVSTDLLPDGGCVLNTFGSFVGPDDTFGFFLEATLNHDAHLYFFDPASPDDPASSAGALPDVNISQGVVAGYDGTRVLLIAKAAMGVQYARFGVDAMAVGSPTNISVSGTPTSMAVSDTAVGVVVENNSSVEFFARTVGGGMSVHPPGVVAAQRGLVEPVVAALDGQFYVFFIAEDEIGDPQVYGSPILCVQE